MTALTQGQLKQTTRMISDIADCDAVQAVLRSLEKEAAERLKGHPQFIPSVQKFVVESIRRYSAEAPNYDLARSILGADFISPEELHPSIIYTAEQLVQLAEMMPSEEKLRWAKANGCAVIAPSPRPLSVLDIRALEPEIFYSKTEGWYANPKEKFASSDKTSFGWMIVKKTPVQGSTNENWTEQSRRLSELEYVPNAAEMAWFITTFLKVHGVKLFDGVYVRTSSLAADGIHVCLGFDAKGLDVINFWVNIRLDLLGLASARK
jgi:hypothetical protein